MKRKKLLKQALAVFMCATLATASPVAAYAENIMPAVSADEEVLKVVVGATGEKKEILSTENVSANKADLVISSASALKEFADKVNNGNTFEGKVVKLGADIVFDAGTVNNYTPIGNNKYRFAGTFDGAGYSVSGINISNAYGGLFNYVGTSAIVKNLIVKNGQLNASSAYSMGAIAVHNYGIIENCANINVKISAGNTSGGITAFNYGTIYNCYSAGDICAKSYVGGIAGYNKGNVYNSCNMGTISAFSSSSSYKFGGVVGEMIGTSSVIENCYNVGKITAASGVIGGIVGYARGTIKNCYRSYESASVNFGSVLSGTVDSNNNAVSEWEMKSSAFANKLTNSRGSHSEWSPWEIHSNLGYAVPAAKYAIGFGTISNGTISANLEYAFKGQTVKITATPKTNYFLSSLKITSANGTVSYKKVDGIYQFTMPASRVTISATFKLPVKISECKATLAKTSFVYSGNANKPEVTVKYGNTILKKGTDYTLAYVNNVKAGTGKVTITGKGNYRGSVTKTFTIKKAEQVIKYKKSYTKTFGAAAFSLNAKVTKGKGKLTYKSSSKNVAVVNNKGKVTIKGTGTAKITITAAATDNFKAKKVTVMITVKPKKQTLSSLKVLGARKLKVTWKKDAKASGYQIQYCMNRNFKNAVTTITVNNKAKTSYTLKQLKKGKQYFVRVRSFKTAKVNGKNQNLFGAWSVIKRSGKIK